MFKISGALVWEYPWGEATPWGVILIFLFGYFHFFVGAFLVHDQNTMKKKITAIGIIYGIGIIAVCIFGPLGMI